MEPLFESGFDILRYGADGVQTRKGEKPLDFFAPQRTNPQLGKVIREVRLRSASGFRSTLGEALPLKPIYLKGLSYVRSRSALDQPAVNIFE